MQHLRRQGGVLTSVELQALLGVSQPTLSRALAPFAGSVPLEGGTFWVEEADGVSARHAGLPWFLDDMRPQGFMGRAFAPANPDLQLGHDPCHWTVDEVLRALALVGDDSSSRQREMRR